MSPREHSTRAFVLRGVPYREADRIVTLLTPDIGKVDAIARGARSSRRRFAGALEPFCLLDVTLAPRPRGLWILEEAALLEAHAGLAAQLDRLSAASYLFQLARDIIPDHVPEPAIFSVLEEALPVLASADRSGCATLAVSAGLRSLASAGLSLVLDRCLVCGKRVPSGARIRLDVGRGGVVCTPCGGGPIALSSRAARALAELPRLTAVEAASYAVEEAVLEEMEKAVCAFVERHLDRPVRRTLSTRRQDSGAAPRDRSTPRD